MDLPGRCLAPNHRCLPMAAALDSSVTRHPFSPVTFSPAKMPTPTSATVTSKNRVRSISPPRGTPANSALLSAPAWLSGELKVAFLFSTARKDAPPISAAISSAIFASPLTLLLRTSTRRRPSLAERAIFCKASGTSSRNTNRSSSAWPPLVWRKPSAKTCRVFFVNSARPMTQPR